MISTEKTLYKDMLPKELIPGHIGYYPVTSYAEWEELPDLYKTMEWEPVADPRDKNIISAVKSVIFDVPYMEPYGIRAKISVHPSEVQKILFCLFENPQCLLYSISAVELENGRKLNAKWVQDSLSGSFCINAGGKRIARQGGFRGFIPEHIIKMEDGTFKFDFKYGEGKTTYYELLNPFRDELYKEKEPQNNTLKEKIAGAVLKSNKKSNQNIQIDKEL